MKHLNILQVKVLHLLFNMHGILSQSSPLINCTLKKRGLNYYSPDTQLETKKYATFRCDNRDMADKRNTVSAVLTPPGIDTHTIHPLNYPTYSSTNLLLSSRLLIGYQTLLNTIIFSLSW